MLTVRYWRQVLVWFALGALVAAVWAVVKRNTRGWLVDELERAIRISANIRMPERKRPVRASVPPIPFWHPGWFRPPMARPIWSDPRELGAKDDDVMPPGYGADGWPSAIEETQPADDANMLLFHPMTEAQLDTNIETIHVHKADAIIDMTRMLPTRDLSLHRFECYIKGDLHFSSFATEEGARSFIAGRRQWARKTS
jgi:hypothetical protein